MASRAFLTSLLLLLPLCMFSRIPPSHCLTCGMSDKIEVADSRSLHLCLHDGARLRRRSVIVKANGTCLLCRKDDGGAEDFDCGRCMTYKRKTVDEWSALLFRTRATNLSSAFDLFFNGASDTKLFTAKELEDSTVAYKSPLFNFVSILSLSKLKMEMIRENGSIGARLLFKYVGGSLTAEGSWFSKETLVSAHPWPAEEIRRKDIQFELKRNAMYFLIRGESLECQAASGYIMVSVNPHQDCMWDASKIAFSVNPDTKWEDNSLESAAEFRISGVFDVNEEDRFFEVQC